MHQVMIPTFTDPTITALILQKDNFILEYVSKQVYLPLRCTINLNDDYSAFHSHLLATHSLDKDDTLSI